MNKNIIIAILIIAIIAVVGLTIFQPHPATTEDGKLNTQLKFLSGASIKNGDTVQFELKDSTGAAISDASLKITYVHNGTTEKYSIITNSDGKGYLVISGEDAGSYDITVDYGGSEKYNACSAKQTITVEKESGTAKTEARQEQTERNSTANTVKYNDVDTSSNTSDSSSGNGNNQNQQFVSQLYFDDEYDVYYDDFGTIRGGPFDGGEIALLRDPNATSLNYFEEENSVEE